ncbi:MarR family winged helix-turn-helix transcriptional regulator [Leifsonia sp. NCR5]|uniref:MarR family winged helix-turn-helix transcriptional regulator n=1 Tax=Leifsonia sp. NCR5 TaxID=1978342 RepID=UPI000A19A1D6|nr:MarR family transcriptional regulator [Leifsonia sp. NCR5]
MTDAEALEGREKDAWLGLLALVQLLPGVLDTQLSRDSAATHYEFFVLSRLAEAPNHRMRLSALATATNASMSRLSHVASRLEARGLIRRQPCEEDGRATNAVLTPAGEDFVRDASPGHLDTVRSTLLGALTADQVEQLAAISTTLVTAIDPSRRPSDSCASIVEAAKHQ